MKITNFELKLNVNFGKEGPNYKNKKIAYCKRRRTSTGKTIPLTSVKTHLKRKRTLLITDNNILKRWKAKWMRWSASNKKMSLKESRG